MELRHIRYFVAVADSGSVSGAARSQLHTSQPSLSRQLLDLEEGLGVKLFDRKSRGIYLTDAGFIFLEHCRQILKQVDDAVAAAQSAPAILRVGILPGLEDTVLPRLNRIVAQYSSGAEMRITGASSPRLIDGLRAGTIDIAFLRQDEDAPDIHFDLTGHNEIALFLSAGHPLARQTEIGYTDLVRQTYVSVARQSAPALWRTIETWAQRKNLSLEPTHEAGNTASAFSLIRAVNGFSLLPTFTSQFLLPGVLVRQLADGPAALPLMIGHRPKSHSRASALVSIVRARWGRDTHHTIAVRSN